MGLPCARAARQGRARKDASEPRSRSDALAIDVCSGGLNVTTDVKTITAKTLFERLAHLVPRFDKTLQKFCQEIAERRNAELHSADLPFRTMRLDAWEARYWHACDTILHQMDSSLKQWLGAADAKAPR